MAAIFEEVTIAWQGEEYTVTPTYRMVQQIEQRVSIAGMSDRIMRGEPPISHMAEVIAIMLRHGGAKVTPEDVYAELMTTDDVEALSGLAHTVVTAFVPGKKSASPAAKPKATGGKKTK